jgi:hypothetical protein
MSEPTSSNTNRIVPALFLIMLGVMGLMGLNLLWPMFILIPGLAMLGIAMFGGKTGAASMSIPGMLVTGTGAMMLVMNMTGIWESWAYAWTLYGAFLGMGFMLMGNRMGDTSLHHVGRGFVNVSLIAFAGFAFFFEFIVNLGGRAPLMALGLIALGLFLITRNAGCQFMQNLIGQVAGLNEKPKRKVKPKREEPLFTGPIVYGARVPSRSTARLSLADDDPSDQSRAHSG